MPVRKMSLWVTVLAGLCMMLTLWPGALPASAQAGCSLPDASRGQTTVYTLSVDGVGRSYRLYLPQTPPEGERYPLVLTLHGFASGALEQEAYSQWNRLAESYGLVAVYPQGLGEPARWNSGSIGLLGLIAPNTADDVGFLSALIDALVQTGCVDAARVYINGLSNGGGMSNRFACQMADTVAAFGSVAGAYGSFGECAPSRPMPVIAFHGTADRIVPYDGQFGILPPVQEWAREWAERDGCTVTDADVFIADDVTMTAYTGCDADVEVVLYTVAEGGHTWPGSTAVNRSPLGRITESIDASEAMWAFFSRYMLPG